MKPEIWDWLQNNYFSVAQPVLKNTAGIYPLILASQQGRRDVVSFLIKQYAALDVIDEYGNNALWAACYAQNSDCIAAFTVLLLLLMQESTSIIKIRPRVLQPSFLQHPAAERPLLNNYWQPVLIRILKRTTISPRWT